MCTNARARAHTHRHILTQINGKLCLLGHYAVEADAAAARDVVAKVLAYPLNFNEPREITGQRSKGADQAVADAVKAANAFLLGDSFFFCLGGSKQVTNQNPEYHHTMSPTPPS